MRYLTPIVISCLIIAGCNKRADMNTEGALNDSASSEVVSLRSKFLMLAEECKPKNGTSEDELRAFWNIKIGHNLPLGRDMAATTIEPSGAGYETKRIDLVYDVQNGIVSNFDIFLNDIGPNYVASRDGKVSIPAAWSEEQYLKESIRWLLLLREKQRAHESAN